MAFRDETGNRYGRLTVISLDSDGYPTEESLKAVQEWDINRGLRALMAYVKEAWRYENYGYWSEEETEAGQLHRLQKVRRYYLSTAGWSGNESLIDAMQKNSVFWSMAWVQSSVGGHYIFELPEETENPKAHARGKRL